MSTIKKWHKLYNGYWLATWFIKSQQKYKYEKNIWLVDIAVAKTKRQVNDHHNKTEKSPKKLYDKSTNNKGGLEALMLTLKDIQLFAKTLPNGSIIRVWGSNEQRRHVYCRLLRYGFKQASWDAPNCWWDKKIYYFLEVNNDIK